MTGDMIKACFGTSFIVSLERIFAFVYCGPIVKDTNIMESVVRVLNNSNDSRLSLQINALAAVMVVRLIAVIILVFNIKSCPECNAIYLKDMEYCDDCGYELMPTCTKCNTLNERDAKHCAECGEVLTRE